MQLSRIDYANTLQENAEYTLTPDVCHRLLHVLRIKVGDKLILFNGNGDDYQATITSIKKKQIIVTTQTKSSIDKESPLHIHLAQSLVKGEKMDFIIQKAVELGVNEITLLNTERSNIKISSERQEKRWQHWQSILIHACEQCGRSQLPTLHRLQDFSTYLSQVKSDHRFILDPDAKSSLPKTIKDNHGSFTLLVGPEGGFSTTEIDLAIQQQFNPIHFGKRILRSETAAIVSIAALQTLLGDFY